MSGGIHPVDLGFFSVLASAGSLSAAARELGITTPAVSKHLRVLSDAGLIEHRSAGTRNLYALAPDGMAAAQQWLVKTWDTALAAYAAEVSRRRSEPSAPEPRRRP